MKDKLRAFLVDDEKLAHKEMRLLLSRIPAVEILGEAYSVAEAETRIRELKPDVIFLDVELSDGLGFDLLPRLDPAIHIIFVTAYEKYAIRAFEVNALDYLTKPIKFARLQQSVQRLLSEITPEPSAKPKAFEASDQIFLRFGNKNQFVHLKDIVVIQSCGDYTEIHLAGQAGGMVLKTMKEWEDALPAASFMRVHRSSIINYRRLREFNVPHDGDATVTLDGHDKPVAVSRRSLPDLRRILKEAPSA